MFQWLLFHVTQYFILGLKKKIKKNLVSLQYKIENKLATCIVDIANMVSLCRLYAFLQILE